jgi:predicted amidohydrolase
MKICAAQIKSFKGDVQRNIEKHKAFIDLAVHNGAEAIIFPELSITGYEPALAKELAVYPNDNSLDDFQQISDSKHIIICVGMPVKADAGILIGMIIFQPNLPRQTYFKQHLHPDEYSYFVAGQQQLFLTIDKQKIAFAICYESLVPEHADNCFKNGATIYIASVAKSVKGVEKAMITLPEIARKYSMIVLMSNCVGLCENDKVECGGKTAAWSNKGVSIGQLNGADEGMLIIDTETQTLIDINRPQIAGKNSA